MIPAAYVTEWGSRAPWPLPVQIEQDLILSRFIVEIATQPLLGRELVFRGGTCLHKIHLRTAMRYSDDLDYVRRTNSPIGPYVDALRDVGERIGLTVSHRQFSGSMVHVYFVAAPTAGPGRITVHVETNIVETDPFMDYITLPYSVTSQWWSGEADVTTFSLEELMSTKLRALYQRRKGRDVFDLWYVLTSQDPDPERIVEGLHHYMSSDVFSYHEFANNLREKLDQRDFRTDMDDLVLRLPADYSVEAAADLVVERLGSRFRDAPPVDDLRYGRWRD